MYGDVVFCEFKRYFLHDRVFQRYYSNWHCPNIFSEITSLIGHKVLWQDCQETVGPSIAFDGVPYINIGYMVKECHQGPDRQKNAKRRKKHIEV